MDLATIPKTATYYHQCDHLNTTVTAAVGAALKASAISTS